MAVLTLEFKSEETIERNAFENHLILTCFNSTVNAQSIL